LRWSDLVLDGPAPHLRVRPAFTLETYGHLIDGDLGPALDFRKELPRALR
jgi:hypothetical protein